MQEHERQTILRLRKNGEAAVPIVPTGVGHTPDIFIGNQLWEMKSPIGNSQKSTIEKQFQRAKKQSKYLVIDSARTKLDDAYIEKQIHKYLNAPSFVHNIVWVKFLKKDEKVIDIKR